MSLTRNREIVVVHFCFRFVRATHAGEAKLRGRMTIVVLIAWPFRCEYGGGPGGFSGLLHNMFYGNAGANHNYGSALTSFDLGSNPVVAGKLQLNGHDRFSEREGRYFNLVQPYQHHENVPCTGINVYSFGLKPEEHQPSGTCNMSRIDNATLHLTLTRDSVHQNRACKVRVYATNYNVLRVMSGMGGLAYSN